MAAAVSVIGPLPGLAITPTPNLMLFLAAMIGFSYPQIMVSTFARAFQSALRAGYADSIGTYLAISGMWSTSFYLGDFIGMTGGGILVTYVGYRYMTVGYVIFYVIFCLIDMAELSWEIEEDKVRKLKEEQEEGKGIAMTTEKKPAAAAVIVKENSSVSLHAVDSSEEMTAAAAAAADSDSVDSSYSTQSETSGAGSPTLAGATLKSQTDT